MKRPIIYTDLWESTFVAEIENFVLYFSSLFYLQKFLDESADFRKKTEGRLVALYLMPVSLGDYTDLVLYHKIEKRGFFVVEKETGEVHKWLGTLKLNGVTKTKES